MPIIELSKRRQKLREYPARRAKRQSPSRADKEPAFRPHIDPAVSSQAHRPHIHRPYAGLPSANHRPIIVQRRTAVDNDGNVGSGPSHIHNDGIIVAAQSTGPGDARRRSGENRLNRPLFCDLGANQRTVSLNDHEGSVDAVFPQHTTHGFEKFPDDRQKPGVEDRSDRPFHHAYRGRKRRTAPERSPGAHAHRRLGRRGRAHRPASRHRRGGSRPGPGRQAGPHSPVAGGWPARGHGGRRHQRRRRAGPGRRRHRHGFGRRPGPGGRRRAALARPTLGHSRRARSGAGHPARHAPEPGLGRRLQPARHSAGRGRALSALPPAAHPLAGRRRHGPQLGLRAGQQPAPARLAAIATSGRRAARGVQAR